MSGQVQLYADFNGANIDGCRAQDGGFRLTILPEATPINPSPWYAFRLVGERGQRVEVKLEYPGFKHRYVPKISTDKRHWEVLPEDQIRAERGGAVTLSIELQGAPVYVSAQEIVTLEQYRSWLDERLKTSAFLEASTLGASLQGRAIVKLGSDAEPGNSGGTVMLVGRQHPPEVSGAIALFAFADELFGASQLAQAFRSEYSIVLIPALNPDGVEAGHWRLNAGGVDLNRDWGPFTQPETRLMRDELARIEAEGELALFLDFHSTFKNVIYTQPDAGEASPRDFAGAWLEAMNICDPAMGMVRQGSHNRALPTSKTYVHETYGVPAITYEMADEADRDDVRSFARMAAREMMAILLTPRGELNNSPPKHCERIDE